MVQALWLNKLASLEQSNSKSWQVHQEDRERDRPDEASHLDFTEAVLQKHLKKHMPLKPHCSSYTPMTFLEQVDGKCLIHDSGVVKISSTSLKWSAVYTPLRTTQNTISFIFYNWLVNHKALVLLNYMNDGRRHSWGHMDKYLIS